jgi:oligopeptide transport system permease protein
MVFPAILISVLMISFNLLGNGLRDAFDPTMRGVTD